MDFDTWIDTAWTDHATDAAGVAARLEREGAPLAGDDAALARLARLAHHLHGDHLGSCDEGRALLARLAARPAAGETTRADVAVYDASLALTASDTAELGTLDPGSRARVQALAASNLSERDAVRAGRWLAAASATVESADLPDTHPAVRALAVAGNNIAATLAERPTLDDTERTLMLQAATAGLVFWRRAGGWREEERALYRLSRSHHKAGDAIEARRHAQACLEIVAAHGDEPLEAFFGWEALGLAEAAAGQPAGHRQALARAREAFERIDPADQGWCRPSLEALESISG